MLPLSSADRPALITSSNRGVKTSIPRKDYNSKAGDEKDKLWCDYYNHPRHTKDTCWSLHGRPPMLGGQGGGSGSGSRGGQGNGSRAHLSTRSDSSFQEEVPPPPSSSEPGSFNSTEIKTL